MINLYSHNRPKAKAFYEALGFKESFRTPKTGEPAHIELKLDGFTIGIATVGAATRHHGLAPQGEGRWIEMVFCGPMIPMRPLRA